MSTLNGTMPPSAFTPPASSPSVGAMFVRQTLAMLVDSYRELSARKLFWLSMILSGVVVLAFAVIGINAEGITLLGYEVGLPIFSTKLMTVPTFYKYLFTTLGVGIWLTWAAAILALVSTAGIIPEFVASGAIETTLSKPIGRVRLLLTKYCCSLLFVGLQVGVFTFCSFLVIGLRGGTWEPGLFWAVPLVLLFFSYLYCVCTLLGLLTRSSIAALLLTVLVWFCIFIMHSGEQALLMFRKQYEVAVVMHDEAIGKLEKKLAEAKRVESEEPLDPKAKQDAAASLSPGQAAAAKAVGDRAAKAIGALFTGGGRKGAGDAAKPEADGDKPAEPLTVKLAKDIERTKTSRDAVASTRDSLGWWHTSVFAVKTLLPKTSETTALLNRVLFKSSELADWQESAAENRNRGGQGQRVGEVRVSQVRIQRAMDEALRSRSLTWVLGTSMGFQILILGITCYIFARRDF